MSSAKTTSGTKTSGKKTTGTKAGGGKVASRKAASDRAARAKAAKAKPAVPQSPNIPASSPTVPGRSSTTSKTLSGGDAVRGARDLKVKVKRAGKLKHSSQLWLERQLNDPYVKRARERGFRSRAAFKLEEMDDKHRFLKPGQRLVDLGCAPGGWCQIAAQRVGLERGKGRVVGIDLLPVDPISGVDLIELDFMAEEAPALLTERLGGKADGVMSDMAANTTGHKKTDHIKIIALAEAALEFAHDILAPGGFFLAKLFQGGDSAQLLGMLKRDFTTVRNLKPGASRADSSELYVLATGFRRKAQQDATAADMSES